LNKTLYIVLFHFLLPSSLMAAYGQNSAPDPESAAVFSGDLGVGVYHSPTVARSNSSSGHVIPYANFDYGSFFGRVDTFGYGITHLGYGNLELVTRVIDDGYTPAVSALGKRKTSVPLGLGTLQIMPYGAVILNAYHDVNQSGGNLVDLIFAERWESGRIALYPQAGAEYRSRNYLRYYYGISDLQASQGGLPSYAPGDATNLFAALFAEIQVSGNWYLNLNLRQTWMDKSITDSPLVERHVLRSGFAAISYRFE